VNEALFFELLFAVWERKNRSFDSDLFSESYEQFVNKSGSWVNKAWRSRFSNSSRWTRNRPFLIV